MNKLNVNVNGNAKLVNSGKVRYMIWNILAIVTCPYATELCKKSCYARKSERMYPGVIPSRQRNYEACESATFVADMIYTIEKELNSKKFSGKQAIFRIHESGDFYSLEYTAKWLEIAKHFEDDDRIYFQAYTKSLPYFVELGYGTESFPKNLVVRSSIWADTKKELVEMTSKYNFPVYTAATKEEMEIAKAVGEAFAKCRCADCGTCQMCGNAKVKKIVCEIH